MSQLLTRIKKEQLEARKQKDTERAQVLTTLLGEVDRASKKATTDSEVEAIIRSFTKGVRKKVEEKPYEGMKKDLETISQIENEFLPKQLSEAEIVELIEGLEDKSVKSVMPFLSRYEKENGVLVDKGFANKYLRSQ